jgi:hypothetical protein
MQRLADKIQGQPWSTVTHIEVVGGPVSGACSYRPAKLRYIGYPIIATSAVGVTFLSLRQCSVAGERAREGGVVTGIEFCIQIILYILFLHVSEWLKLPDLLVSPEPGKAQASSSRNLQMCHLVWMRCRIADEKLNRSSAQPGNLPRQFRSK